MGIAGNMARRAARAAAAAAVAAAVAACWPGCAHAFSISYGDIDVGGEVAVSCLEGGGNSRFFMTSGKVASLASSDPGVVRVRARPGGYGFDATARRPGRARVTYEAGGRGRAVSFRVLGYSNPVRTFKVGARDYARKFGKARSYRLPGRRRDMGRLHVAAAKGWRLEKVYSGFSERNSIALRNGGRLGGALNVRVVLVNKRTGVRETVELVNG